MARLNDYAAPAESVDALKRRFVRQNREIMRVNSMQSMRIRSLESEVSHLLSENVSLRGEIITLTQENERLVSAKALQNGVYEIKARLDAKLAELNSIVSDLGTLPRKAGKLPNGKPLFDSDRPKAEGPPRANDPDYIAEMEDGKLPAILEDKYYPRKTLEPQEVHALVEDDSCLPESPRIDRLQSEPDHLETGIEDTALKSDEPQSDNQSNDPTSPETYLPPTLETRKKKRKPESAGPVAATPSSDMENGHATTPNVEAANTGTSLKFGSKRKFSLDDDIIFDLAPEDDDFQFSRLSRSPQRQKEPFQFVAQDASPSKTPVNMKRGSTNTAVNTAATKRKVLEPKSVNSNLGSPKKARAASQRDDKPQRTSKTGQDENMPSPQKPKELGTSKTKTPSSRPRGRPPLLLQKAKRISQASEKENPTPIQPKKVTPKDSPIAKSRESLSESDEAASRPSRRRGAVVSYAEPNLRAKMRRPTKDMADAVTGRRSSSFQLDGDTDETGDEPRASSGGYPLADMVLPKVLSKDGDEGKDNDNGDGDGDAEQVLASVSRRKRKVSSVSRKDDSDQDEKTSISQRQSRRHSSNPKSTTAIDLDESWSSQADSSFDNDDLTGWKMPSGIDTGRRETRIGTRRRSMMV